MRKSLFGIILLIISLNFALAGNITLDYPSEVEIGEEFTMTLKLIDFPEGNYDIKFDTSSSGGNYFRIFNDGVWKSSHYFVINAIANNEEKDFSVKVPEYEGEIDFRIRIRATGTTNVLSDFEGYKITSVPGNGGSGGPGNNNTGNNNSGTNNNNNNNNGNSGDDEGNESSGSEDEEDGENENDNENYVSLENSSKLNIKETNTTPIRLTGMNAKDIKTNNSNDNSGGIEFAKYSIVMFCIVLLFLYIIKPKNKKNEFKT